jgi:hypothetical protein
LALTTRSNPTMLTEKDQLQTFIGNSTLIRFVNLQLTNFLVVLRRAKTLPIELSTTALRCSIAELRLVS